MGTFLLVEKNVFTVNGYKLPSILETKTMVISQGWFCPLGNTCRYVCKHFLLSWFEAVGENGATGIWWTEAKGKSWSTLQRRGKPPLTNDVEPGKSWSVCWKNLHVSFNLQLLETLRYYFLLKVLKIEL